MIWLYAIMALAALLLVVVTAFAWMLDFDGIIGGDDDKPTK